MRVFVGGVNGSGKSTVLKMASELSGYHVLHGAGLLMEYLHCEGDYEKLRSFSAEEKGSAYTQVIENVCREKGDFLLDSHYLTLIRGEVTNMTTDRLKNFDLLVLISTPLEVLWDRLQNDIRDRALFPPNISLEKRKEILANYQTQTLKEFNHAVKEYNVPGIHIQNDSGDPEKAALELHNYILSLEK